jgi:hypothetical protein
MQKTTARRSKGISAFQCHGKAAILTLRSGGAQRRPWSNFMNGTLSLSELEDRIAILRDNVRQLVEQAAGAAGSENEERAADRIAKQSAELDKLVSERDARLKK